MEFELITGELGMDSAEERYLSRLTLRLEAERGSVLEVAVRYDGGAWEVVDTLAARESRRSYDLPFVPRRHGTFRLRLHGRGQITLRSLARTMASARGGLLQTE